MNQYGLIFFITASGASVAGVLGSPIDTFARRPTGTPSQVAHQQRLKAVQESLSDLREALTPPLKPLNADQKDTEDQQDDQSDYFTSLTEEEATRMLDVGRETLDGCKRHVLARLNKLVVESEQNGYSVGEALRELRAKYYRLCEPAFMEELADVWQAFALNVPSHQPQLPTIEGSPQVYPAGGVSEKPRLEIGNDGTVLNGIKAKFNRTTSVVIELEVPLGTSFRRRAAQPSEVEQRHQVKAVHKSLVKLREALKPSLETSDHDLQVTESHDDDELEHSMVPSEDEATEALAVGQETLGGCKRHVLAWLNELVNEAGLMSPRVYEAARKLRANYYRLCEPVFVRELEEAWHAFAVNEPHNESQSSAIGGSPEVEAKGPLSGAASRETWSDGEALESLIGDIIASRPTEESPGHTGMTDIKSLVRGIATNALVRRQLNLGNGFSSWKQQVSRAIVEPCERFRGRLGPLLDACADFDEDLLSQLDPLIVRLMVYDKFSLSVSNLFPRFAFSSFKMALGLAGDSDTSTDDRETTIPVALEPSSPKDDVPVDGLERTIAVTPRPRPAETTTSVAPRSRPPQARTTLASTSRPFIRRLFGCCMT